jgi:hypothetical protein
VCVCVCCSPFRFRRVLVLFYLCLLFSSSSVCCVLSLSLSLPLSLLSLSRVFIFTSLLATMCARVSELDETINDYMSQRMGAQELNSRSENRTGRFTFKNGATFEGAWLDGLPSGEGIYGTSVVLVCMCVCVCVCVCRCVCDSRCCICIDVRDRCVCFFLSFLGRGFWSSSSLIALMCLPFFFFSRCSYVPSFSSSSSSFFILKQHNQSTLMFSLSLSLSL